MSWLDALLCPLAQLAELVGATAVVSICAGLFGGAVAAAAVVRLIGKLQTAGSATSGARWVTAVLVALGVYLLAVLCDPLLGAVLDRPSAVPEEVWARIGFFEWKLMGGQWSWPVLPLADHPGVGIVVHLLFWCLFALFVNAALAWLHNRGGVAWDTPEALVPRTHRWAGSTTARRADGRFRRWMRPLLLVFVPLHLLSGYLLATEADGRQARRTLECTDGSLGVDEGADTPLSDLFGLPAEVAGGAGADGLPAALGGAVRDRLAGGAIPGAPPPGAWVLAGLLLLALSVHLILEGRPPDPKKEEEKEDGDDVGGAPPPPEDPLRRLGDALQASMPGAFLESLEEHPAVPGQSAGFSDRTGPLTREAFESLTSGGAPWSHQREVLDHLERVWRMAAPTGPGAAPTLREEQGPSPVHEEETDTPHALILAPEGSGRTTLTCLAALHVHLDRGATTLVVTHDREAARAWAGRLRDALSRSSTRWNVQVAVAGEDAAEALLAGRTPAVLVAGLEELETDLLGSERTDPFFQRLGLIVAEDVDRFTGVAEMHLHMVMRRVWALLDTVHDAPYPAALLAVAGPSGSGMEAWARHVLAAPLRIFDRDGAPRLVQVLLRRRDLADATGEPIPLGTVAEACDRAELPWHLRRAGDEGRHLRRQETELGPLRRHHVADPADAEVVLLEGTYPDVRREAERLAHAGLRTGLGSVVLVLAPPSDEEMVLHEEAVDAAHRALAESLPRAVPLSEPDVVRQRHLDRALGREQDVEALRERFGASLVDEILGRLEQAGRIRYRSVWFFDARADDAAERRLVSTTGETALGEPIAAGCVSDSSERVELIDRGTSEVLSRVDRAVARAFHPPGSIFLHARGRYAVIEEGERTLWCEQVTEPHRTTPDRSVAIEAPSVDWSERQLGGAPLSIGLARARVRETFHGMRRHGPGPTLVESRSYERPVSASYVSDVCLLATEASEGEPLAWEALVPLSAAIRMMLPCLLRGAGELVDVGLAEVAERRTLVFFDRTPGASGFTRHLHERGLGDLLRLARLVLERLVGPELSRLHRIHDTAFVDDIGPDLWRVREALAWLDRALDRPPGETRGQGSEERRGRRVEWTPGEGPGDLGRLWVSSTGRTDDLVWTRHPFDSKHPLGDQPAGPVFIDVAVERRTIAHAVRRAVAAGASPRVVELPEAQAWIAQHHAALATASIDLVALIDRLRALAGDHQVDTVLSMVAAIPTHPRPIPVAERAPLAVLSRRRADRDAKVLLAWAMLPTSARPTVRMSDEGPVLEVRRDGQVQIVDLSGNAIRTVDGDAGAALALSWEQGGAPGGGAGDGDPEAP